MAPADPGSGEIPVGTLEAGSEHVPIASTALWIFFSLFMAGALILDLRWGAKRASSGRHVAGAAVSSVAWFSMGIAFAVFLWCFHDVDTALTFLTGYFVEKSLSVDNLIVIALIFKSFRIKPVFQAPVLKWGIIGAVVFRTIFIFAGITLLEYFHSAFYIFGALLLWSAYKMFFDEDDDGDFESHKKGDSWMMRLLTLFIPYSAEAHCSKFVVKINGRWHATPMLAALVVVELSDLIFAVDSIPCILGLTQDLFLVFSSNMLAILGLRSLYLLLAEALEKVKNLKQGLAIVLVFVGLKMIAGSYFPISQHASLLVIVMILGVTFIQSAMSGSPKRGDGLQLPL